MKFPLNVILLNVIVVNGNLLSVIFGWGNYNKRQFTVILMSVILLIVALLNATAPKDRLWVLKQFPSYAIYKKELAVT